MVKKFLVLLMLVLVPAALFAGTTGKIAGVVRDKETGDPLPGANVIVVGTTLGAAANVNGEYVILNVPPGTYSVKASFIGYRDVTVSNVRVNIDLTTEVIFDLPSEAIEVGAVEIVAERPLVNKNATNEVHIRTAEDIESVPVRGYANVVALEAGVVRRGGTLYIRGGRRDEVAYYVDGVYQNNPYTLGRAGDLIHTSIEEISYQAGGYNAEYGFANSGVINTTTKTGGSQYTLSGEWITDEYLKEREETLGAYSYGYNLYNMALSGPVPALGDKVKFYLAGERRFFRDSSPTIAPFPAFVKVGTDDQIVYPAPGVIPAGQTLFGAGHIQVVDPDNLIFRFPEAISYGAAGDTVDAQFRMLEGPKPNSASSQWHWNGNVVLDFQTLKFKIGGNSSRFDNRNYNHFFSLLNGLRNSRTKSWTDSYYIKATHTLGASTFYTATVSWFRTKSETGDPFWFDDIYNAGDKDDIATSDGKVGSDGKFNPWLRGNGQDPAPVDEFVRFAAPGDIFSSFSRNRSSYIGVKADITHQAGRVHEIKAGFEYRYNTIRNYSISTARLASNIASFGEVSDLVFRASYANNIGYTLDGRQNLDGDDPAAAKHPVVLGAYIQDKLEYRDLVLNIGLRLDYFDSNTERFQDPTNIRFVGGLIDPAQLEPPKTYTNINPRLGLSFPVTDRTVFHAQYGKFTQHPELNRLFISPVVFANNLQAGNFTISGNPNLAPVKTTQYELGFRQQIGDNIAFNITAYYKELRDLIQLQQVFPSPDAAHGQYTAYANGDYGTVKGLSFSFDLRRTQRVAARASYTLQFAGATGSNATTGARIAWLGGNTITFVSPTDFDQRHTGSVNVDIRTRADDGPLFLNGHPLGNVGLNLLFTFGSGLPYTPRRPPIVSAIFATGPSAVNRPGAPINSAHMPWTYNMDVRLDKRFEVGGIEFDAYLWVINLLNAKNVQAVFTTTGDAANDGWLATPEGRTWAKDNPIAANFYLPRIQDPFRWGAPRQYRFGLRFTIK
jgi:outer membrane receptor protein involved in Fe transport